MKTHTSYPFAAVDSFQQISPNFDARQATCDACWLDSVAVFWSPAHHVCMLMFLFRADLSDEDEKLLFAVLDRDGSSRISEAEFMDFGSVLMLDFIKVSLWVTFFCVWWR